MKKWKLAWIALSVSMIGSVQVAYAANPISQQQVNNLFCNSNLPIPSNLCPTSSPTARNPASQQYVCERYLAVKSPVAIGETVGNGIVYYVDSLGRRGLIAAMSDVLVPLVPGVFDWDIAGPPNMDIPDAVGVALFTGKSNTNAIVTALTPGAGQAAEAARAYLAPACPATITCDPTYSLPSQGELTLLWVQYSALNIPGFSLVDDGYWSSTQSPAGSDDAIFMLFPSGVVSSFVKDTAYRVRPVRYFYY